jgi:hypothetical protein
LKFAGGASGIGELQEAKRAHAARLRELAKKLKRDPSRVLPVAR